MTEVTSKFRKRMTAAVVGTGFIGPVHVEGLGRAGVNVAGIVGSTSGKSAAAAEALGLSLPTDWVCYRFDSKL